MTKKLPYDWKIIERQGEQWLIQQYGTHRLELSLNGPSQPPRVVQERNRLLAAARVALSDAGLPTDEEAMVRAGLVGTDGANLFDHPGQAEASLADNWLGPLIENYGHFHPLTVAARFLWAFQTITAWACTDTKSPEAINHHLACVLHFADAWFYWRMECDGLNTKAYGGERSSENLDKGRKAPKVARKQLYKSTIGNDLYSDLSAKTVAHTHFKNVCANFNVAREKPPKNVSSLARTILNLRNERAGK
jgi:hypothetical protein